MKNLKRIIPAVLLILVLVASSFVPSYASEAKSITYSKEYNSGQRNVVCTTLDGTSAASYYKNYSYDDLSKQSSTQLFSTLQTLMRNTHSKTSSYNDCHNLADKTDCQNEDGSVSLIYTSYSATMGQWNGWNREHVWPQSLGGGNTTGGGADLHHIRPSDAGVNGTRGNKKYGEVGSGATQKYGTNPAVGVLGGTYDSTYFEPLDNVKGDVARICLYMYVRWNSNWGAENITDVFQSVDVLLKWCEEDPVDTWEMGRNEVVQSIQGNRNVFIDYPEYAWIIFGKSVPTSMTTPSMSAFSGDSGSGSTTCTHANQTTTTVEATCTASGSTTVKCADCGVTVNTTTIPATGHSYENESCTVCGAAKPNSGSGSSGGDEIIFDFGDNGDASHSDGSDLGASATYTSGSYSLNITGASKVYKNARDAAGNSALKFGSSSAVGTITFTVPDDVVSVQIHAAKYKANASTIVVNGTSKSLTNSSNNGTYDVITVDTSTNKTVTVSTASGGYRMMVDKIVYVLESASAECEHSYKATITAPTCTAGGYTTYTCTKCDDSYTADSTSATGHVNTSESIKNATCTENGAKTVTCNDCGATVSTSSVPATGHNYVAGVCTGCGDTLSTYTCTFKHPEGSYTSSATGDSITMPEAPTLLGAYKKNYTFVGWVTSEIADTSVAPTVYSAGEIVEISKDTTFHALYSYTTGSGSTSGNVFEKYSGTITEGDYVIYYNGYAMNNTVESGRLQETQISPSNNTITSPDSSIIWKITAVDGYYTLYNEATGKYAAGTGANNKAQLLTSITNYAKWTVSGTSTYEFVNAGNTGNKNLRNNGTYGFACYSTSTGGALTLYKRAASAEALNYTTSPEFDCAHTSTSTQTVSATCTAPGSITVICNICGIIVSTNETEPAGHSLVDGVCVRCGYMEPVNTPDSTEGEWVLVSNASDLKAGDKIVIVCDTFVAGSVSSSIMASVSGLGISNGVITTLPSGAMILTVGGSSDAWTLANENGDLLGATAVKKLAWNSGTTTWSITISDGNATIQNGTSSYGRFLYNSSSPRFTTYTSGTSTSMFLPQIYKLNEASNEDTELKISAASVTVGSTLAMHYYVSGYDASASYYMIFTMNGATSERIEGIAKDGYLKFTFTNIPPQCMADSISAALYSETSSAPLTTLENYSIKIYAQRIIAKHSDNKALLDLVADMLRYGSTAQIYLDYKPDDLVTDNLDTNGIDISSYGSKATPTDTIRSIVYHKEKNPALTFSAAGVRFDYDNKVYVKITAESLNEVSVKINGEEAVIKTLNSGEYVVYSESISALKFDSEFIFELYSGSEKLETLTYSVNSYIHSKYDNGNDMADLALALYRYGLSAKAYA